MNDPRRRIRAVFDAEPAITDDEIRVASQRRRIRNHLVLGASGGVVLLGVVLTLTLLGVTGSATHKLVVRTALPSTATSSPGLSAANTETQRILNRLELPPGSHGVEIISGAQFDGGLGVPECNPQTHETRFWTIAGSVESVIAYLKAHPAIGSERSEGGGSTGGAAPSAQVVMEFSYAPQWRLEILDVSIGEIASGQVGVRADAYVAPLSSNCAQSGTATRPAG